MLYMSVAFESNRRPSLGKKGLQTILFKMTY